MNFSKLSNIVNDINAVLLPRLCFGCNARLYRGEQHLCAFCRNQIPLTDYDYVVENAVDRIFYGRIDIKKASSFLFYMEKGITKNIIHHLKYNNQPVIGDFLGTWYGQILQQTKQLQNIDYVIPVPLHRSKLKKRGYNQVDSFGKRIAQSLQSRFLSTCLVKTANTKTQTKKGRFFRSKYTSDLYKIIDKEVLSNKSVLLVDDVITTGATIEACAKALDKVKNIKIYILTMAVVP
ncbi:ComF family protein [Eudoraea chungangensis]|uniref:ComF family protein n=1 Tax=Eudoraea chungangensis TaxID=1481905 RepID=UPI0023EB20F7|nr:phosphoribosyltransferase family protein [Eudoraea chungangensis]